MASEINDGGPAFPIPEVPTVMQAWPGMSLRDWFAGMVLPQAMGESPSVEIAATLAYRMADAMLAAREAGDE